MVDNLPWALWGHNGGVQCKEMGAFESYFQDNASHKHSSLVDLKGPEINNQNGVSFGWIFNLKVRSILNVVKLGRDTIHRGWMGMRRRESDFSPWWAPHRGRSETLPPGKMLIIHSTGVFKILTPIL